MKFLIFILRIIFVILGLGLCCFWIYLGGGMVYGMIFTKFNFIGLFFWELPLLGFGVYCLIKFISLVWILFIKPERNITPKRTIQSLLLPRFNKKRFLMSEPEIDKSKPKIIAVFEKLELNPSQTSNNITEWIADCPSDNSHKVSINIGSDSWECATCGKQGSTLELEYFSYFLEEASIKEKLVNKIEKFNQLMNTNYSYKTLPSQWDEIKRWSAYQKGKLNEIYELKSQYQSIFNQLDQLRISVMVQRLDNDEALNEDLTKWWANRY